MELYKWVKREFDEEKALEVVAVTEQARIVPVDTTVSLLAADLSLVHDLSFTDAIIYATSRQTEVELITSNSSL